jgi:hypothetical protein
MAGFSSTAERVVEDFAAGLGLPAIRAPDGTYGFIFERSGTLSLVASEDGRRVIVSVARVPFWSNVVTERCFLDVAGLDATTGALVHAGMAPDGSLVLAMDIDDDKFDLQSIDRSLRRLFELHDSLV